MKRVLLSGGGTGGHIYPALAIARALRKRYPDIEISYIGTKDGLEAEVVPKEVDIYFYAIEIQGFKRSISWQNINTIKKFICAVKKSKQYIKEFKPDVVVGTGGYVSGPPVYAACRLGVPTLIHEQNVVLGLTTKFLSRFVDVVAISLEESKKYLRSKRIVYTGNPRATEVVQANAAVGKKTLDILDSNKLIVLFLGGSRGARIINEMVLKLVPHMGELPNVQFIYVTGETYFEEVCSRIDIDKYFNLSIKPFIYNMPDVLAATYLVISRAGASTLAELTSLGLPSILIPSPYVTNGHQEANALWMQENGASKMILERDCTPDNLWIGIRDLIKNREKHHLMSEASRKLGRPQAVELLIDELERLV